MRISHNIAAMNTYRQYNVNASNANKSMEKLSSGYRINRAADDAAGLSISEKMRSQIQGLEQANRNAQDGISFIQTAEGALTEVSDMLTRLKELAVQVQNGTYSETDKANIGAEMNALGNAIADIYTDTEFNGIKVFGAQAQTTDGILDAKTVDDATDPNQQAAVIHYGEDASQKLIITQATTTALNALTAATGAFASATDAAGQASAAAAVTSSLVEAAITEVNTTRATYGAQQNQLEHMYNNMSATQENLQSAESRIRDVDMADEMMEYTKNNILLQASQSMLAQANTQPQSILQLLQ